MNENRPCKKELLEWINIVSFAVDDVKLSRHSPKLYRSTGIF